MAGSKRIQKELEEMMKNPNSSIRNIDVNETNIFLWRALILPEKVPYNKGAFKIEVVFPAEYPFKPPKVTFLTKIYHPNIDEKGQVCLPIVASENWKPATKICQVIESLIGLVNDPEPDHPLRGDLSEEFLTNKKKFIKNAEDFTKKYSEKRP